MIREKTVRHYALIVLAALGLGACEGGPGLFGSSMYEETVVTQRPIELVETRFVETVPGRAVTHDYLTALSEDYMRHGDSPLYVVFGYDPADEKARLPAFNRANIVRGQLGKLGIRDAVVRTEPIPGSDGTAVVAFDRLTAQGPANCGTMPGTDGVPTGAYQAYGLGCGVKSEMAKQIAYPSDLEGRAGLGENYDGGRAAATVNRDVRTGERSDFVPSYILSELAGSTSE